MSGTFKWTALCRWKMPRPSSGLQDHTNRIENTCTSCHKYGMSISIAKTETKMTGRFLWPSTLQSPTHLYDKQKEFSCLDSFFTEDLKLDSWIESLTPAAESPGKKAGNKTSRDKIKNEVIRDIIGTKPILDDLNTIASNALHTWWEWTQIATALRTYTMLALRLQTKGMLTRKWLEGIKQPLSDNNISMAESTEKNPRTTSIHYPATPKRFKSCKWQLKVKRSKWLKDE